MNIWRQLENLTPTQRAVFKVEAGVVEVCPADYVINYFQARFGFYQTTDDVDRLFALYQSMNNANFTRAYNALVESYDPLKNYDITETRVKLKDDGDETIERTDDTTETNTATDVENVGEITSFDSTSFRNADKTTQNGETTTTNSGTVTTVRSNEAKTLSFEGSTYTADYVEAEKIEKSGTTTDVQKALAAELEIRKTSLIENYLDTFIARYAFLALFGGCEI